MRARVLLDTNIVIHREAAKIRRSDIGLLFNWLDRLNVEKYVHPDSMAEIEKHVDESVKQSFRAKLGAYNVFSTSIPLSEKLLTISGSDISANDRIDTILLNELIAGRVDFIITEDKGIRRKARSVGRGDDVFSIEGYLERVAAEHPEFTNYSVLATRKTIFGKVDVSAPFFDSFRQDYGGDAFDRWFLRKSEEVAYICTDAERLVAFLYLKVEEENENYSDITPQFQRAKRLKIGTFKVELNGYKIGERFMKIVFDNAVTQSVDEIYVTIFDQSVDQLRLIRLLEHFGFDRFGVKSNAYGEELVYCRKIERKASIENPRTSFPFISLSARHMLVPIYPSYHTSLLPDSILRTEANETFDDQAPHRNAISKVYVSRSYNRDIKRGDVLVFYRTKDGGSAYYTSVITTLGIVEDVHFNIRSLEEFQSICRRRSVFSERELESHWTYSTSKPFVIGFLYAYTFPKRPNLKTLIEHGVISDVDAAPRGFEPITRQKFEAILELTESDRRFVIN